MKKIHLIYILLFVAFVQNATAQYYYSDIIANNNNNKAYSIYKSNNIKTIIVKNVTQQQDDENAFAMKQEFSKNFTVLESETNLPNGSKKIFTTTYADNKVSKKEDEGLNVVSLIRYEYNAANQLTAIRTSSVDTSAEFSDGFFEKHLFYYDAQGILSKMYKIKNNSDTTTIVFIKDEHNNIGEEKWYRKNNLIDVYYYYYNEQNQLTDIVKFNERFQKMLPLFMFEYNSENQVSQTTQVPFGTSNYTITKYTYNSKGLKTNEALFTKHNELLSKLEYVYE